MLLKHAQNHVINIACAHGRRQNRRCRVLQSPIHDRTHQCIFLWLHMDSIQWSPRKNKSKSAIFNKNVMLLVRRAILSSGRFALAIGCREVVAWWGREGNIRGKQKRYCTTVLSFATLPLKMISVCPSWVSPPFPAFLHLLLSATCHQ